MRFGRRDPLEQNTRCLTHECGAQESGQPARGFFDNRIEQGIYDIRVELIQRGFKHAAEHLREAVRAIIQLRPRPVEQRRYRQECRYRQSRQNAGNRQFRICFPFDVPREPYQDQNGHRGIYKSEGEVCGKRQPDTQRAERRNPQWRPVAEGKRNCRKQETEGERITAGCNQVVHHEGVVHKAGKQRPLKELVYCNDLTEIKSRQDVNSRPQQGGSAYCKM